MAARCVFKYDLKEHANEAAFALQLPRNAYLLSLKEQKNRPVLWALVDPDAPKTDRRFILVQTGDEVLEQPGYSLSFVDTVLLNNDTFVLHLFEVIEI